MDVKDLRSEAVLSERNDGIKYAPSSGTVPCARKSYQDMGASPLGKVDASSARPCAVIGPDRVLPPPISSESLKKGAYEAWCMENVYRHPPEYPHKLPNYQTPIRNISPRQTFQENMQRIMVSPNYNALKGNEEPFPIDKNVSLSKNMKTNIPSETKYCEVPYTVNPTNNEQKNVRNGDLSVSSVNPVLTQTAPHGWPPNVRPPRPFGAPELYQYPEYNSCAGPRPVPMNRPHRTVLEDPAHVYPDHYSHDGNIRYKPYPTFKERYPPPRYEYISNYSNPFHPPPSFPPHKPLPPTYAYSHVPLKYIDGRIPDAMMDGYQRSGPQGNYNLQFRNQIIHPAYGPVLGNCVQNKYPCPPDGPLKTVASNKLPYETNKMYLDYENTRSKTFPVSVSENFYLNEISRSHHPKNQILSNYAPGNMHGIPPHPYYRKDTSPIKYSYDMPHFRNMDPSIMLSRIPSQFSPSSIAISPSDSNASNDTTQIQGNLQEDCGYVSQSPTTSIRSMDSGINRTSNDFYRRYDTRYGPPARTSLVSKPELNSNSINTKEKKNIDVRQFLQMWNEVDDENGENSTKDVTQLHTEDKVPNQYEINKKQDQLYVLGLVNVPNEELGKYEHIQKVSKLPENIKGYNNIELLNQFEEVIESTNVSHFNSKQASRNISYRTPIKGSASHQNAMLLSRPVSPLDVEAKISQSVIHKEVGCNFEIKPCSPKMLNVEIATPVQTVLGERVIEKVTNPLIMGQSMLHREEKTDCKVMSHADTSSTPGEILKIPSCKMINTPFTANDSVRPNYSLQDLESNSGVCLASLPRLDNDIELNFPEVNQQFINANKGESVITKKKNISLIVDQPENVLIKTNENSMPHESESSYELSPIIESEREFPKLSKYRKMKKSGSGLIEKDTQAHFSSQNIRTDSVIIKNPENSKIFEQSKETVDPISNLAESIQEDLYYSNSHYENRRNLDITKNIETESNMPIAIDFSLKNENSNEKVVSPLSRDFTSDTFKSNHSSSAECGGDNETYDDLQFQNRTHELNDSDNNIFKISDTKLLLDLRLDANLKQNSKNVIEPLNEIDLLAQTQDEIQSPLQESSKNILKVTSQSHKMQLEKEICEENILKAISSPAHCNMQSPEKEICEANVRNVLPSPTNLMQLPEKEICKDNVLNTVPSLTECMKQSLEKEICEDNVLKAILSPTQHLTQSPIKDICEVSVLNAVLSPTHNLKQSPQKKMSEVIVLNTAPSMTPNLIQSPEIEMYEDNVLNGVLSPTRCLIQSPEKKICEDNVPNAATSPTQHIISPKNEINNVINTVPSPSQRLIQSPEKEICENNILNAVPSPTQRLMQSPKKDICEDNVLNAIQSPTQCRMQSPEKEICDDNVLEAVSLPTRCSMQLPEKEICEDNILNAVSPPTQCLMQSLDKEICEDNILNAVSPPSQILVQSSEEAVCKDNIFKAASSPSKHNMESLVKERIEKKKVIALSENLNNDQLMRADGNSSYSETKSKVTSNTLTSPVSDKIFVESPTTTEEILKTSSCADKFTIENEGNNRHLLCDTQNFTRTTLCYKNTVDGPQNNICNQNGIEEQKEIIQKDDSSVQNKTSIEIEPPMVPQHLHFLNDHQENVDNLESNFPYMQIPKSKKTVNQNEESDLDYHIKSNLKEYNKLIHFNKELFSPWIQNLICCIEGPTQIAVNNVGSLLNNLEHSTVSNILGDATLTKSPSDTKTEKTINDIDLDNSRNITTIVSSLVNASNDDHSSKNKETSIDNNDSYINNISSEIKETVQASYNRDSKENIDQAGIENIHVDKLDHFINDKDESTVSNDIKDNPDGLEYVENVPISYAAKLSTETYKEQPKQDIEDSLFSDIEYNKQFAEPIESPVQDISNKSHLKRSFSDSALDRFNNDSNDDFQFGWQTKRRKRNLRDFIEPNLIEDDFCSFPNNRRNSISSMYNEENVSICILIDNNCIITEDVSGEEEKMCYTETEISLTNAACSDQCDNTESVTDVMLCSQVDNDQCSKSLTPVFSEEKSFEESWVEDIACVETVVSDDIAEDITVSGASSPKESSSENEDSKIFMTQRNHSDKVKHIYGDKMCNDDAQFLETLYRTPQMDVNKTLISRESQIFEECNQYYNNDSLEKILSESNNQEKDKSELEALLTDSNSRCSSECLQMVDTKLDKENFDTQNLSPIINHLFSGSGATSKPDPDTVDEDTVQKRKLFKKAQDDLVHSCESSTDNVFSYNQRDECTNYTCSSSPEVSSTTSEEKNSGILLKITNYKGSRISQINDAKHENKKISCKFTEANHYSSSIHNLPANRPLITKGAQKYIPPLKETFSDLKIRLPLPQHSLIRLKQLKLMKNEPKQNKYNNSIKKEIPKKSKPKFEDVLKSIDEMQFKMHKEKSKKVKKTIPKVVIKKNENGSHYASTANKESFNPDLTGRKWQPWVFLEKNNFIDKMAVKNKKKAVYNHRKDSYVLAEKFRKYKSIGSAKFIISQPKLDDTSTGQLKCTIRLKHEL